MSNITILYLFSEKLEKVLNNNIFSKNYIFKKLESLKFLNNFIVENKVDLFIAYLKKDEIEFFQKILINEFDCKSRIFVPMLFLCEDDNHFILLKSYLKGFVFDFFISDMKNEIIKNKVENLIRFKTENIFLYNSNSRFKALLSLTQDGIWEFNINEENIIFHKIIHDLFNEDFNVLDDDTYTILISDFYKYIHIAEKDMVKNCIDTILQTRKFEMEYRIRNKAGLYSFVKMKGFLFNDFYDCPSKIIGTISFIRQDTPIWLRGMGRDSYDALTGIANRDLFYDHLKLAMAYASRYNCLAAVLLLDIDHFKRVNDSLGHDFGDLLLKEVAERLKPCVRSTDTLARMGGDEFIILILDMNKIQNAVNIANKVLKIFHEPFKISTYEIFVTASIGISIYPDDGEDIESIVKNADTAMYRAKNQGRNTYQLYAPEMNARTFEILSLETRLRKGISQDEFIVYYQPRVNIRSGRIVGVEALVRWQHPDLGLVPPSAFIPIAEETGLIIPLGEQVLYKACKEHARWMEEGISPIQLAVNLSARQFQKDGLVEDIINIVEKSGMNIDCLELEITESMAMKDLQQTITVLNKLRKHSIKIAMDDFGTGYSSLSNLKKYPLNTLKIDQSFLREMIIDRDVITIVKAIIELAKGLQLHMIVEGVENYEQLELARSLGCLEMQGYLFSPPMSSEEIEIMLKNGKIVLTGIL